MTHKTKKIIGLVSGGLVSLLMLISVAVKVYFIDTNPDLEAMFKRGGIYDLRYYLAIADLIIVFISFYPRTSMLGFLLMTGYWGGATATVLTHGDYQELPIHFIVLALLAVCSWFRFPEAWSRFLKKPFNPKDWL